MISSAPSRSRSGGALCLLAGLGLGLGGAGCADWSRGPTSTGAGADGGAGADAAGAVGTDGGAEGSAAQLTFADPIHGLLISACQPCHSTGQEAGDTMYLLTGDATADYTTVSQFIDTSAPAGSQLLVKMSGSGHGGGTVYAADSPEYLSILRWIQEGAPP
jgi:hypothetical protein